VESKNQYFGGEEMIMQDDEKIQLLLEKVFGPGAARRLLFTAKEVSQLIGRAEQTLANDRSTRRGLAYIKVGRSVRYKLADVLAYVEGHRIDPEGQ
jgi:hypothetical protein